MLTTSVDAILFLHFCNDHKISLPLPSSLISTLFKIPTILINIINFATSQDIILYHMTFTLTRNVYSVKNDELCALTQHYISIDSNSFSRKSKL